MKLFTFRTARIISTFGRMRLLFVFAVLFCCCPELYSQCKLERKTDEYSKSETVYSPNITLLSKKPFGYGEVWWNLDIRFLTVDSSLVLYVTHASQAYSSALLSIFFKFNDGTIMKLTELVGCSKSRSGEYSLTFSSFSLTKEELKKIATAQLEKFQAVFADFENYPIVDCEIKQKSRDRIKKDASCMFLELK